jgi:outer membrane protein assembly factor BamB
VTAIYGTLRENAARIPTVPCHLTAPLREVWNARAHIGAYGHGAPLLAAGGRLFVTHKDRHLVALDAASQKRVWRSDWPISGSAIVHDGHVFVWTSDDELQLLDLETGRPRRSMLAPPPSQAVASGPVLVACDRDYEYAQYGGERLYAVEWTTGRRLWSERLPPDHTVEGILTASDDVLVHGVMERAASNLASAIVARRLGTGAVLWRKPDVDISGIAAVHRDHIVGATGSRAWAFALRDGALQWENEDAGGGYLYGDRLYTVGYGSRYTILDVATGKSVRSWDLSARMPKSLQPGGLRVLLVSETHVFFASERNMLLAFTRESGEYVSNHHPKGAYLKGEAVCVDGRFYYQNGPDRIYCLEPRG